MKKAVSYGGYLIVTAGGMAVSLFRVLPVENTVVFLLGLFWAWNGVSVLLGLGYPVRKAAVPAHRCIWGLSDLAMGGVWTGMALTPLADRFWPMLAASAPFLLVDLLAKFYFEGKR